MGLHLLFAFLALWMIDNLSLFSSSGFTSIYFVLIHPHVSTSACCRQTAGGFAAVSTSEAPEASLLTRIGEQATCVYTHKSPRADKANIDDAVGDLLALSVAYKDRAGTACLVTRLE